MSRINKKWMGSIAIACIMLFLYLIMNRQTVYEVYASDRILGQTSNSSLILSEYEKLQQAEQNAHPDLNHGPIQELKLVKKQEWFPEDGTDRIINELPGLLNPLVQASEILVNGEVVAVVANQEQANKAISLLKSPFETETGTIVELVEQVIFQPVAANPESVVTAERAAEVMSQVKTEPVYYQVEDGDTLWDIAQNTNTPFEKLVLMNPDSGDLLKAGQKVLLSPVSRLVNIQTNTQKQEQRSIPFRTIVQSGTVQEQEGKEGLKEVTVQVTGMNGVQIASDLLEEKIVQEPVDQIRVKKPRVQVASLRSASSENSRFIWPTEGGILTTGFEYRDGEFHNGYDIAGAKSLNIKASASGKVVYSGWKTGYGNIIILSHANGYTTYYAHNKENLVSVGDQVEQWQVIAIMGSTGESTGVHLHFEIRSKGQAMDPGPYLK